MIRLLKRYVNRLIATRPLILASLLCVTYLTGCGAEDALQSMVGTYEGFVIAAAPSDSVIPPNPFAITDDILLGERQVLVTASITKVMDLYYNVNLRSADRHRSWYIQVHVISGDEVEIKVRPVGNRLFSPLRLKKKSEECYFSEDEQARLCSFAGELYVELPESYCGERLTVLAERVDGVSRTPVFEAPQSFTYRDIILRSMNQSFDNRMEFERVIQARLNAQHAALSLLPHFSANSALSLIMFGALGPLAIIGDIAPFLFPTRWTQARQAAILSDAEFAAYAAMKADAANIAEGLTLALERDAKILALLEDGIVLVNNLYESLAARTSAGIASIELLADARGIVTSLRRNIGNIRHLRTSELYALSMAMGFYNPEAIMSIGTSGLTMEGAAVPNSRQHLVDLALRRSYELRQIDHLVNAAEWGAAERTFAWIDPAGNPAGSLGFALPSYIAIGLSQVTEMQVRRERTQAQIIQRVYQAYDLMAQSLENYESAHANSEIQQLRYNNIQLAYELGGNTTGLDVFMALQERMRTSADLIDSEYSYYLAQSKLNRLAYTGPYSRLSIERGRMFVERSVQIIPAVAR